MGFGMMCEFFSFFLSFLFFLFWFWFWFYIAHLIITYQLNNRTTDHIRYTTRYTQNRTFTQPDIPPRPNYPEGFQGNDIPLDGAVVARLVERRLSLGEGEVEGEGEDEGEKDAREEEAGIEVEDGLR